MEKIKDILKLSDSEIKNISNYLDFLLEYNNKINLIGKSTIDDIWNRHILDCLQLIRIIDDKNVKIADLGSGAGLPGILLSIVGIKEVHLFEKSVRKCEFLEKAKKFSPNKIVVHNEDIATVNDPTFNIITSRALGNLNLLLKFSQNLKNDDTKLLFLKGRKIYEELNEAKKYWKIDYKLIDSITAADGKIVEIDRFRKV